MLQATGYLRLESQHVRSSHAAEGLNLQRRRTEGFLTLAVAAIKSWHVSRKIHVYRMDFLHIFTKNPLYFK